MINDKRGVSTVWILVGIMIVFGAALLLIIIGAVSVNINDALDQNVTIGNVNLKTVNEQTFGQYNTMVLNNADWWGLAIIFGMIIGLFLIAYFARDTFPKISIVIDIFFIFSAFLLSLYLSAAYAVVVNALSSAGQTFAQTNLEKTSFFILNLPKFVVIIGVIMMILFHSGIPRKPEELNIGQGLVPT